MTDPIFVRTAKNDAYRDFWHLALLSDYSIVGPHMVDLARTDLAYIFPTLDQDMMACLDRFPKGSGKRGARTIFWNLERPDAQLKPGMDLKETYQEGVRQILEWVDEIWVSDRLVHRLDGWTKFAILGGHPDLIKRIPGTGMEVDVVHIGQGTPRRQKILDALRPVCHLEDGLDLGWGTERTHALSKSKILLGIDRVEGLHLANPLRWVLGAAALVPIVHEAVLDPYPLVQDSSILMAPYARLAEAALDAVCHHPELGRIASGAYETFCRQWTFRRGVEAALKI